MGLEVHESGKGRGEEWWLSVPVLLVPGAGLGILIIGQDPSHRYSRSWGQQAHRITSS